MCIRWMTAETLVITLASIVAGGIASVAGFGIGSILTPTLSLWMDGRLAVAVVSIPHLIGTAVRFAMVKGRVDRQVVWRFGLASAAGGLTGALFQTVVSEDLRKATTKDGVFSYLRKEFDNDPVIKALDQAQVDRYAKDYDFRTGRYTSFSSLDHGPQFLPADVYIESFAKIEEKVGINRATKKVASAPFLVYTATITSEYGDRPLEVKEEGFILGNIEVTRKFAEKIKAAVRDEMGPGIPKDAARFRRRTEGMTGERINASDALRNLFKKK